MREGFGGRRMLVGVRSSGWLLGSVPAAAGEPWHVTAEALQPARVRRLSIQRFREQVDADRQFRWAVFRMMALDLVDRTTRTALFLEDLGGRVARVLTDLAARSASRDLMESCCRI